MDAGIDWSVFLTLALFAIRQVPNRDVGFSPHCLVYGKDVVGPLDVLYKGWVNRDFDGINVNEWLLSLNDRLAVIHDIAVCNESVSSSKRALVFRLRNLWKLDPESPWHESCLAGCLGRTLPCSG